MLSPGLPAVHDAEGDRVPDFLPPVIDAHVHLFPDDLFQSVWKWFDQHGWPIRYQLTSEAILKFLISRGVRHVVGLHYAHKPGMAGFLNRYMATLCDRYDILTGTATVFPGEKDARKILKDGFEMGLTGVKLHAHVQCLDMESRAMYEICETCAENSMPIVIHAGREPKSPAYSCDPYVICGAEKVHRVLKDFPTLNLCVPHLGADEFDAYARMCEEHDNLWLDTAMIVSGYLPWGTIPPLNSLRIDRVLYGTDFPNIPYAWDRELNALAALKLSEDRLSRLLFRNAAKLFRITENGRKSCAISRGSNV